MFLTHAEGAPTDAPAPAGTPSTPALSSPEAVVYRGDMAIDADGSPRAYHPTDDDKALDYRANGYPWAIVKVREKPYIQKKGDPAPGFYVSTTSLHDPEKALTDPARYVNAETVPYLAIAPRLRDDEGVSLGDLAAAVDLQTGQTAYAIVADIGNDDTVGEGSIALAKDLGLDFTPKKGGTPVDILYIVFPGNR